MALRFVDAPSHTSIDVLTHACETTLVFHYKFSFHSFGTGKIRALPSKLF